MLSRFLPLVMLCWVTMSLGIAAEGAGEKKASSATAPSQEAEGMTDSEQRMLDTSAFSTPAASVDSSSNVSHNSSSNASGAVSGTATKSEKTPSPHTREAAPTLDPLTLPRVKLPQVGDWAQWEIHIPEWHSMKSLWQDVKLSTSPRTLGAVLTIRMRIEAVDGKEVRYLIEWLERGEVVMSDASSSLPAFFQMPEKGLENSFQKKTRYSFGRTRLDAMETHWKSSEWDGELVLLTSTAVPIGPLRLRFQQMELEMTAYGDASGMVQTVEKRKSPEAGKTPASKKVETP